MCWVAFFVLCFVVFMVLSLCSETNCSLCGCCKEVEETGRISHLRATTGTGGTRLRTMGELGSSNFFSFLNGNFCGGWGLILWRFETLLLFWAQPRVCPLDSGLTGKIAYGDPKDEFFC